MSAQALCFQYGRTGAIGAVLATTICLALLYLFKTNRLAARIQAVRMFETSYREVCGKFNSKVEENERLHEELVLARQNLVEATRLATLGELSTAIAHEILNPLSALTNCIGALKQSATGNREDENLLCSAYAPWRSAE